MNELLGRIRKQIELSPTSHGPNEAPEPPLTQDDICRAELIMGVRLPDILKLLYTEIGNGGFGPGFGLLPLVFDGESARTVVRCYSQYTCENGWHHSMIPFSSWGCGIFSCVDSDFEDPPVYRFEPNMPASMTASYLGDMPYKGAQLIPERLTLSQWLDEWLLGRSEEMFNRLNSN